MGCKQWVTEEGLKTFDRVTIVDRNFAFSQDLGTKNV